MNCSGLTNTVTPTTSHSAAAALDERAVPGVQCPHGGDDTDAAPEGPLGVEGGGELRGAVHDAHRPGTAGPARARCRGVGSWCAAPSGAVAPSVGGEVLRRASGRRPVGDQATGQGDAGVVPGDLGGLQREAVALERGLVAARRGAGQGGDGPQLGGVGERGAGQAEERVEVEAGRDRDPLHLAHERHQVVGGDARRGVIGGAGFVVDDHDRPPEHTGELGGHRVTGHGEGDPAAQADPAHLGRGQRHERVQRRPAGMGGEHLEPERPRQVDDHGGRVGLDARRHLGDGGIGGRDHEDVDAVGGRGHVVMAPQERLHVASGIGERRSQ